VSGSEGFVDATENLLDPPILFSLCSGDLLLLAALDGCRVRR
jgi:hypothetical protein